MWRGFVIDKYKSWVTAAGNLEKRGMNNAEIASILGISARFVFRIIPAIDFGDHVPIFKNIMVYFLN